MSQGVDTNNLIKYHERCHYKNTDYVSLNGKERVELFHAGYECDENAIEDKEFCIFHDNQFHLTHPQEVIERLMEKIEDSIKYNKALYCIGYHIPPVRIRKSFHQPIYFEKAIFHGKADFHHSQFKVANFRDAIFHEVDFSETEFEYGLFSNTIFSIVDFSMTQFIKVDVKNATFLEKVIFSKATFDNDIDFSTTSFMGIVKFLEVKFENKVNFSQVEFNKNITFASSQFVKGVNFSKAIFKEFVDFSNVKFNSESDFSFGTFFGPVKFYKIELNETSSITFSACKFKATADFSYSQFNGSSYFIETIFNNESDFTDCVFQNTTFQYCNFMEKVIFREVKFGSESLVLLLFLMWLISFNQNLL